MVLSSRLARALPLAVLLLGLAFALKWWYRTATVEDLGFVLRPVASIVSLFTGTPYAFVADEGFRFPALGMVVDRSCSGVNFFVITMATLTFMVMRNVSGGCSRPLQALFVLPVAYVLTIITNAARILTLLFLDRMAGPLGPTAHEAIGAFVFLAFLLIASLLVHRLFSSSRTTHANVA